MKTTILAAVTCTVLLALVEIQFGGVTAARYVALALGAFALGYFVGTLVPRG